ncbi:MAG: hypothetical protein LBU39_03885 [Desulfobulbaceae bacterium]|jgi:hypothetical protein|nr:hypothetical protein [Desulfobulbaceae bacterium]
MNERERQDLVMAAVWNWRGGVAGPKRRSLLVRALMLFVGFAVAALLWFWGRQLAAMVIAAIAAVIFLFSCFCPQLSSRFESMLLSLAHLVGVALGWLFLTPVFYCCFTVGRLLQVFSGRDPMRRRLADDDASYWLDRMEDSDPERYRRQYL